MLDALVIGQGIAGSILAYDLHKKGLTVHILNDTSKSAASLVAAGLIQTISGRYLSIAKDSLTQINTALAYYQKLEKEFQQSFISPIKCYRYLTDEQLKKWEQKKQKVPYQTFLSNTLIQAPHIKNSALNFIEIFNNFHINPKTLIQAYQAFFKDKNILFNGSFDEDLCKQKDGYIEYKQFKCKKIILCTGHYSASSNLTKHTTFNNVKGETQTIKLDQADINCVYQGSEWMVPFGQKTYKIGATYDHHLTLTTTIEGQERLSKLTSTLGFNNPDIIEKQAGIRCVTKDRQPLISTHPENKHILFFTGFGSKGFMTCPFYKDQFIKQHF